MEEPQITIRITGIFNGERLDRTIPFYEIEHSIIDTGELLHALARELEQDT